MACLIVDTLLFLGLTAISGALIAVLAHSHDYGYYFAFFDSGVGEEYLRIIVGFGIMATYVKGVSCFPLALGRIAPQ